MKNIKWKTRHKNALEAVNYIKDTYGEVYDYCGGWCNNDVLGNLLNAPTYENAYRQLTSLIERYYYNGTDGESYTNLSLNKEDWKNDKKLKKIYNKYLKDSIKN